jgi:hypothetical protein
MWISSFLMCLESLSGMIAVSGGPMKVWDIEYCLLWRLCECFDDSHWRVDPESFYLW